MRRALLRCLVFTIACGATVIAAWPIARTPPTLPQAATIGGAAFVRFEEPILPDPLPIRRVLQSAASWDVRNGALRRLPREEFEAKVQRAARANLAPPLPPRLAVAKYKAEYSAGQLVGSAEWTAINPSGRTATFELPNFNFALGPAKWLDGTETRIYRGKSAGTFVDLPANAESTLRFAWSLRSSGDPDEDRFELGLPPSPINEVEIRLPEGAVPVGITAGNLTGPFPIANSGHRLWRWNGTGIPALNFSVRRSANGESRPLVGRSVRYDFELGAVRGRFEFQIDSPRGPLGEIAFEVDPGFRVRDVVGEPRERWSVESNRLRLRFGEPTASKKIVVLAEADLPTTPVEWKCPGVAVAGSRHGPDRLEAAIPADWKLEGWSQGDYRLIAAGQETERIYRLQFAGSFAQDRNARKLPTLRFRPGEPEFRTDESLEWSVESGQTRGVARVKLTPLRGPLPGWELKLDPNATLESAVLLPAIDPIDFHPLAGSPGSWWLEPARAIATGQAVEFQLEFHAPGPNAPGLSDQSPAERISPFPKFAFPAAVVRDGTFTLIGREGNLNAKAILPVNPLPNGPSIAYRGREPLGNGAYVPERAVASLAGVELSVAAGKATVKLALHGDGPPFGSLLIHLPHSEAELHADGATVTRSPILDFLPLSGSLDGWSAIVSAGAIQPGSTWRVEYPGPQRGEVHLTAIYPIAPTTAGQPWRIPIPSIGGAETADVKIALSPELNASYRVEEGESTERGLRALGPELMLSSKASLPLAPIAPPSAQWRFEGLRQSTELDGQGTPRVALAGRILESAERFLTLDLPAEAECETVRIGGKWMDGLGTSNRLRIDLPEIAEAGLPFEIHYRLPRPNAWPLPSYYSPTPIFPGEPSWIREWIFPPDWKPWPSLDTRSDRTTGESIRVARSPVLFGFGIVLALWLGLFGIAGLARRATNRWLGFAAAACGIALLLLPEGWGFVLRPAALVALLLFVASIVRSAFATPPVAKKPFAPLGSFIGACVVLTIGIPAPAQAPEPTAVYLLRDGERWSVYAPVALLDKLEALASPPRREPILLNADYSGTLRESLAEFEATFTIERFEDTESNYSLLLSGVRLEEFLVDGLPAFPEASKPDRYAVALKGLGRRELRVKFAIAPTATGGEREVRFAIPDASNCRVAFSPGKSGRNAEIATRKGSQKTRADGSIEADHGAGRTLGIQWRESTGSNTPSTMTVKEAILWEASDNDPSLLAAFAFKVEGGGRDEFRMSLPEELNVAKLAIRSAESRTGRITLKDWSVGPVENGWKTLAFRLSEPVEGKFLALLRAVPSAALSPNPALRFPKTLDVPEAGRESHYALRFGAASVANMDIAGAIDFPAEAFLKDFPPVPEFNLDRAPPQRVLRRAPEANAEIRPQLVALGAGKTHAAEVQFSLGGWAEVEGAMRVSGKEIAALEFHVPERIDVRSVRGIGLIGWSRTGTRIQAWFRGGADEQTVRWSGSLTLDAAAAELPLPRWTSSAGPTEGPIVRVKAAEGWIVAPKMLSGWNAKPLIASADWSYATEANAAPGLFEVRPIPPVETPVVREPEVQQPPAPKPVPVEVTPEPDANPVGSTPLAAPIRTILWGTGFLAACWLGFQRARKWWPESLVLLGLLGLELFGWWNHFAAPFALPIAVGLLVRIKRMMGR